jgi:hypothetical protein
MRDYKQSSLTIEIRPTGAKIDLGKTPLPPNSGRIAPLTSRQ